MDAFKLLVDMLSGLFIVLRVMWPIWLLAAIWVGIKLAWKFYKAYPLSRSGIIELDNLDGLDFEKYLEGLFRKLGYTVKRTVYQGDYGADLIIQKAGVQTVVQAKRYNRNVGLKAIQEVVAAKSYYHCQKAMVITNHAYTQQAKKLAKANDVELWDRDDLVKTLLSVKQNAVSNEEPAIISTLQSGAFSLADRAQSVPAVLCEECGTMVSPQVQSYCLSHPAVFGGKIYCYEHQKVIRQQARLKAANVNKG